MVLYLFCALLYKCITNLLSHSFKCLGLLTGFLFLCAEVFVHFAFQSCHTEESRCDGKLSTEQRLLQRLLGHAAEAQRLAQVVSSTLCTNVPDESLPRRPRPVGLSSRQRHLARRRHGALHLHGPGAAQAAADGDDGRSTVRLPSRPHRGRGWHRRAGRHTGVPLLPLRVPLLRTVL